MVEAPHDLRRGYEVLHEGMAALELARDVVRVGGPDAERYLQGQLSQDIAKLEPGGWAWSLVLQPQGKLDAFVRCYRQGADEFFLDSDAGVGGHLVERLLRFRLRTKVDVELLGWRVTAVRGPGAVLADDGGDAAMVVVPFEWGGLSGYDLAAPELVMPEGAEPVSEEAYEAARVEAGFPRHGAELDERTIPAEAGLVAASVSFTKGCYTGQELVARIDSRGSNVPRRLRGLLLSAEGEAGGPLLDAAGKQVGQLTSVALSPRLGWVALGYTGRSVELGEMLHVGSTGSEVRATVHELPLGKSLST